MIEFAEKWLESNASLLDKLSVTIIETRKYVVTEYDRSVGKPGVTNFWVDIENTQNLARLTIWETGECDLDVLSITGNNSWGETRTIGSFSDIDLAFRKLLEKM